MVHEQDQTYSKYNPRAHCASVDVDGVDDLVNRLGHFQEINFPAVPWASTRLLFPQLHQEHTSIFRLSSHHGYFCITFPSKYMHDHGHDEEGSHEKVHPDTLEVHGSEICCV